MNLDWVKQKIKEDSRGCLGALFMAFFAILSLYRWADSGSLFFLLLSFRDIVFTGLLLQRNEPIRTCARSEEILSYISTGLPLLYTSPIVLIPSWMALTTNLISVLGFFIATLAVIELGNQIGVAPAMRGLRKSSGIYRIIQHPMYVGYIIAEFGWVIVNPRNILLFVASAGFYILRMKIENRVLEGQVLDVS